TAGQVVRAQLDHDPVLGEDPDVVLTHLARAVCENLVTVRQLDPEHCVRESLDDRALDLDDTVLLGHILFLLTVVVLVAPAWSSQGYPRGMSMVEGRAHAWPRWAHDTD